MSGAMAVAFGVGLVVYLVLVQMFGMHLLLAGGVLMAVTWIGAGLAGWADPGVLAVEGLGFLLVLAIALRWTLRHRAWNDRIARDLKEGEDKRLQIQESVNDLKSRIGTKTTQIERGMKLYELVKRLAEALSWEEMSPTLDRSLKHFFRVEAWALYLTDDHDQLQPVQRRGTVPDLLPEELGRKEAYITRTTVGGGADPVRQATILTLPLWRLHEPIGVLQLRIPAVDKAAEAGILAEANMFTTQLIFAMAKAKLFRELDQRSRTDGLTGLSRRGPFEERLKEEVARAKTFRTTFSVLMIDIDHFKRMNDTYGHQVGDEVLRTVSQRLKEGLYETDVIARYGGEEFVCLLPRSDPAGLLTKANQIRERVGAQAFIIGTEEIHVTISIGVAHFPRDGETAVSIMAAADKALYAAKDSGRNCVLEAAA